MARKPATRTPDDPRVDDLSERVRVLSPLAVQVGVLSSAVDGLRDTVEGGFERVNAKLDDGAMRIGALERDAAQREGAAAERKAIYEEIHKRSMLQIMTRGWAKPALAGALIASGVEVLKHVI